jgi:hypothetical protein
MKNFEITKTATGYILTIDGAAVDKWGKPSEAPHVYRNKYLAQLAERYLKNITVTVSSDEDSTDVVVKWSKPKHTRKK